MDNSADIDRFYAQSRSDENMEFVNRQKSVFGQLDAVVKEKEESLGKYNSPHRPMIVDGYKSLKRQRHDTKQFVGQESIFKRPEAQLPPRFIRNIPDYQRHPQKWTKYTLSDVSDEDMSDRSNTAAALTFLQEIRAKKEAEQMDVENDKKEITFVKPSILRNKASSANTQDIFESSSFRSSKVIMPEYVVGQKLNSKKNIRQQRDKPKKCKEIKLEHLEEEDDEF